MLLTNSILWEIRTDHQVGVLDNMAHKKFLLEGFCGYPFVHSPRKLLVDARFIVTTSTTPKHQNKDEDGDVNPALRHVAVQVDDVTPL